MRAQTAVSSAPAAQSGKLTIYQVTLPDGRVVMSSKALLHDENERALNVVDSQALTTKPIKEHDSDAILFLAKFVVLCNADQNKLTFKHSNKKIPEYPVWSNIFQFLFGPKFDIYHLNVAQSQLATFSACIARPQLLLAANDVVYAALCGDEDLARRMIAANPNYLLQRGSTTDFSNRKYDNLTPFQAALITGDDVMAEMMKPFFLHLPNGEAEMQRQFAKIFRNGIEAHIASQKQNAFNFDAIFNAINTASATEITAALNLEGARFDETDEARAKPNEALNLTEKLNRFREQFTLKSHSEKIFNPHHFLNVFEAYVNKFGWNNPDWHKLDLFWRQVIGFVQRFLPANYAQAFAYSLHDIVENKHRCPRSFNFRYDPAYSFHPPTGWCGGLGFNWASGIARMGGRPHEAADIVNMRWMVTKLMSNKNNRLAELITQRVQSTHCCVI